MVIDTAMTGQAIHTSQSFSGDRRRVAVVVCLLACPENLVLDVQEAIDQAVFSVLGKAGLVEAKVQ